MVTQNQTVFRSSHKRNYTVIGNELIKNSELTWKAKGIIIYLLSKPEDWVTRLDDIVKHSTDGRAAVLSGLKELKQKGYLEKVRITDPKTGQVSHWETIVHEHPTPRSPDVENRHSGNPDSGNPQSGKSNPTNYGSIQSTDQKNASLTNTQNREQSANAQNVCERDGDNSFSNLSSQGGEESLAPSITGQPDQKPKPKPSAESSAKLNNNLAQEIVDHANENGWTLKVTKGLRKASEGKTWDELFNALLAMCEQHESEEGLKHEQRYFTRAVDEGWVASEEWHERQHEKRQKRKEQQRRAKESARVKDALRQMVTDGQIDLINYTDQWYSYRLPGDQTSYNANAWDLPKGYSWKEEAA